SSIVSGRPYGERLPRTLRPVQYTMAPASPSARAMPRPAPRVAPATRATRPVNGLPEGGFFAMVVSVCSKLNACLVYVKNEMSPRRRKAEDVDVFAALVRVMLRRGPAELTLRAIAAEAGVTAGALVHRFGSKRALLHAHARYAAATGDIGVGAALEARAASPLQ